MTKRRHQLILFLWAAALVVAAAVFHDRLLPGDKPAQPPALAASPGGVSPPQVQAGEFHPPPSVRLPSERLHHALKAVNPAYDGRGEFVEQEGKIIVVLARTGVADLSPLRGLPLEALDISGNPVSDLSPLKGQPLHRLGLEDTTVVDLAPLHGMPLAELYLSRTPVGDLSALKGLPISVLNLCDTNVEDLTPLADMPLKMLWLSGTRVKDISPLRNCPLVSLTLEKTSVADLSPLAGSALERLHVGESSVTDLTPLRGLRLTRLIFTPGQITRGIEVPREMSSIREIGATLERRMTPETFWKTYTSGEGGRP